MPFFTPRRLLRSPLTRTTFEKALLQDVTFGRYAKQEGNVYRGTSLQGVHFLPFSNFVDVRFESITKAEGQKAKKTTLTNVTFGKHSTFQDVSFAGVSLRHVVFGENCDLRGVDFTGADLSHVTFKAGCNLTGARFDEASLNNVTFVRCDCRQASFASCSIKKQVQFDYGDLRGATFAGSQLGKKGGCTLVTCGSLPPPSRQRWGRDSVKRATMRSMGGMERRSCRSHKQATKAREAKRDLERCWQLRKG